MIYFNINIRNPRWWNRFDNIKSWFGSTFIKHKYWEVQLARVSELFRVEFEWTVCQDHAGINLELALLGYAIMLSVSDNRHWNYEENCWETTDHTIK